MADAVNWPLEYFSLGMYDVGSSRRLDEVGRGIAEFAKAPIDTTFEHFHRQEQAIARLEAAGDQRAANEVRGRIGFDLASLIAGTGATAQQVVRAGARNLDRVQRVANERGEALIAREGVSAEVLFERRMQLIADSDFGPLNQPVRERPDFYVNSQGEVLNATAYRYMGVEGNAYLERTLGTRQAPATYIGFNAYETGAAARDAYQIFYERGNPKSWSDARLRGEFDSLQLYDRQTGNLKVRVPREAGDKGPGLEPITSFYPQYGRGGAAQVIAKEEYRPLMINFFEVKILPE